MEKESPIRIILADDHEIFRDGFHSLLLNQTAIELVAEAGNGEQLIMLTEQYLPDIVITDIKMPVIDGIEATRIITAKHPGIAVIALSMYEDDHLITDMLDAGARGYLLKNAQKREILESVTHVYRNLPYYCSTTSTILAKLISTRRYNPANAAERISFSEKEKEIICLICREYSNKDISAELHLSVRTIEGYRERILEKTNAKNTAGIVVHAIRNKIYIP